MNILLVGIHAEPSPQAVPLGNYFLKTYLQTDDQLASQVRVELAEFYKTETPEICVEKILAMNPDAVGFSIYAWNRLPSLAIISLLRQKRPGITVFAGGAEVTAAPEGFLTGDLLDFIIVGEGEIPFLEAAGRLLAGQPVKGVKGIMTSPDDPAEHHPVPLVETIPSPILTGNLDLKSYRGMLWQLSRGCDFRCAFCYEGTGRGVRRFSLERIETELKQMVKAGVDQIFILDPTFNIHPERAKDILHIIKRHAPHIHFHFETRSEFLDAEMADLFAGLTCSLQVGLQSAQPEVLRNVRRNIDHDDFRNKIALLNESGAIFGFDLIYALPGDTLAGFRDSVDFALSLYPNHLDIFPLSVLPGTELGRTADEHGLLHLPDPPYTVLSTPTFSAGDLAAAARLANASDIFYTRGKAVAWFNGVLRALDVTPTAFLEAFAIWLQEARGSVTERDLSDAEIAELQKGFLPVIFGNMKKEKLLPLALDLVEYHYAFGAAVMTPEPELPTDREIELLDKEKAAFSLTDAARLATFSYEIYDILETGEVDLGDFVKCFRKAKSFAAIYPRAGEVFTESLIEPYYRLLKNLDGKTPLRDLCRKLRIDLREASEFVEFALAEGIVRVGAKG